MINNIHFGEKNVTRLYFGSSLFWVVNSFDATPDDYILSYRFNGNMIDDSSNNLSGVKVGNTSYEVGRKLGTQCIRFTAGAVKTPTALPLNTAKVTISFWVKFYSGGGYIFEMSENHNDKLNAFGATLAADAGELTLAVTNATYTNSHYEKASLLGIGVWQHVIITVDRGQSFADEIKIYVNNELKSTVGAYPVNNYSNLTGNFLPYVLNIGSRAGTSQFSNCAMQDFRVYDRVLTSEEISSLYEE